MNSKLGLYTAFNLSPKTTGLKFVVWIFHREDHSRPDEWIKISRFPNTAPYPISRDLHWLDVDSLGRWIKLNQKTLQAFWCGDIEYTEDVLRELKPIE